MLSFALQEKGRCGTQKNDKSCKVWQTGRRGQRKKGGGAFKEGEKKEKYQKGDG